MPTRDTAITRVLRGALEVRHAGWGRERGGGGGGAGEGGGGSREPNARPPCRTLRRAQAASC